MDGPRDRSLHDEKARVRWLDSGWFQMCRAGIDVSMSGCHWSVVRDEMVARLDRTTGLVPDAIRLNPKYRHHARLKKAWFGYVLTSVFLLLLPPSSQGVVRLELIGKVVLEKS